MSKKKIQLQYLFLLVFSILLSGQITAQSEETRTNWTAAKDLCNEDKYQKAKPYLLKVYAEMPRPLCCYWLAMAYDIEEKRDSAIFYYGKCIKNSRKPQLAALDNLIRVHLRQLDFETAYIIAWDALTKNPGNEVFIEEFKEVCLWAYFIKHLGFHKHYLTSTKLHKEYQVKTITEQSLIIKNIRNEGGQHLHVGNRQHKGHHEIWKCRFNHSKKDIEVKFHLHDHNLDKQIEIQHEKAKKVYNNKEEAIHIRLGALMALTPFTDKQVLDLLASDKEEVRLCTCSELNSATSKKVKKACMNDASEHIKAMCEKLDIYQK